MTSKEIAAVIEEVNAPASRLEMPLWEIAYQLSCSNERRVKESPETSVLLTEAVHLLRATGANLRNPLVIKSDMVDDIEAWLFKHRHSLDR